MMRLRRSSAYIVLVCLTAGGLSSCFVRRRLIVRPGGNGSAAPTLLVTDREALIGVISREYSSIQDFNATVDMTPVLGSAEKSRITEYKDVRGFILLRKPNDIRIIGLFPVVRNKAFDMVSTGNTFRLYVPTQNQFVEGSNDLIELSKNKIENLRPSHFLDALLVRPVDPTRDKLLLENFTDEDNAYYILQVIHSSSGELHLDRTIWFNRLNLQISRQLIFDENGNILTDARYSDWRAYDNVPFPKHIEINRPRDEYGVVIDVVKMDINKGVASDKFQLSQPAGTKLRVLGQSATESNSAPPQGPPK
jgi:outer membrane lipoprotein-sorting protein